MRCQELCSQECSNVTANYSPLDNPNNIFLDDKLIHEQNITRMTRLAMAIMAKDWVSLVEVETIMSEAYKSVDLEFGIEEANEWANGFQSPSSVVWKDALELYNCNWDLNMVATKKNLILINYRFSAERLNALWNRDDPDFQLLLELAEGVLVWRDVDFIPALTPPPLSRAYKKRECSYQQIML